LLKGGGVMRPRIGYKKLAAVGVAAVIGVASTIALTSGSASAAPVFGYRGYGYGTDVQSGMASGGPQVLSQMGCSTDPHQYFKNDLATANVNKQAIARAVKTVTYSFNDDRGNGVTSTAVASEIRLGDLLTLKGASASTTAVYKDGKFQYTGGTKFLSATIGGVPVPALLTPASNTKVAVPGIGYIVLNSAGGVKTASGIYSYAQAVVIYSTVKNKYLPLGAQVVVLKTRAEVSAPATALVIGNAYGTKANVGNAVTSGPTSLQTACRGTEGKTVSISVAEVKVPGLTSAGGVTTTQNGFIGQDKSAVTLTSKVAGVKLGNLSIGAIESSASAWKTKDGKTGLSSSSKVLSITVGNKKYDVPNQPNQTLDIPGIAKLTFNRVTQQSRYISIDALVINADSLKSTIVIGHSAAGVIG
jgi:hypothetical protein